MCVLGLNTAIEPYSFAIIQDGILLDSVLTSVTYAVSENIMLEVEARLRRLSKTWTDLEAIYVVDGPGSYTGLRIGISFVKTLAMVLNIPVYSVGALSVLASQVLHEKGVAMAVVGARKKEFNIQLFSFIQDKVSPLSPLMSFSQDELGHLLNQFESSIIVTGQVAGLKQDVLPTSPLIFIDAYVKGESVITFNEGGRGDYRRIMPKYSHVPILIKS
jgi:tRNA threonylcarbamoyladenosine biosynthesis protein TsaB